MPAVREKEKIEKVIQSLPDDAQIEDAMERLYLLYKVEKGCQKATPEMDRLTWTPQALDDIEAICKQDELD